MIRNNDQYNITKHWLLKFKTSVRLLNKYVDVRDLLYRTQIDTLNCQIEVFKKEIKAYAPNDPFIE